MPYVTNFVKTIFRQWYRHACERVMQLSAGLLCAKMGGTPHCGVVPPTGASNTWGSPSSLALLLACDGAVEELEVVLVGVARAVEKEQQERFQHVVD